MLLAYFLPMYTGKRSQIPWQIWMVCVSDWVHNVSSYIQAPGTYGQKYVNVPAYMWVITTKLIYSVWLFLEPHSRTRLVALWFSHGQFTWLRLCYFLFLKLNIFVDSLYSSCMVFGITLAQAFIAGPNGVILWILYLFSCAVFLRRSSWSVVSGGSEELARSAAHYLTNQELDLFLKELKKCGKSKKEKLKVLFHHVDVSNDGIVLFAELVLFLRKAGVTLTHAADIFEELDDDKSGSVTVNEFVENKKMLLMIEQFEKDCYFELRKRMRRTQTVARMFKQFDLAEDEEERKLVSNQHAVSDSGTGFAEYTAKIERFTVTSAVDDRRTTLDVVRDKGDTAADADAEDAKVAVEMAPRESAKMSEEAQLKMHERVVSDGLAGTSIHDDVTAAMNMTVDEVKKIDDSEHEEEDDDDNEKE